MATGSEGYAGINANRGKSRRRATPASRRTGSTRRGGSVATANGFPIF